MPKGLLFLACLLVLIGARGPAAAQEPPAPAGALPAEVEAPPPSEPADDAEQPVAQEDVEVPASERPELVIKTILGLLALLALAYAGGHLRVVRWEERLGISQVVTAGFPFVLLGVMARHPAVGVLNDDILTEISPVLRIGLGWIGLVVGLRFDARLLQGLPRGAGGIVLLSTLLPLLFVTSSYALAVAALDSGSLAGLGRTDLARDALVLGVGGVITARSAVRPFHRQPGTFHKVVLLEELVGIFGLALVAATFRPRGPDVSWQIPEAAWFLLTIGLGTTIGLLAHVMLHGSRGRADLLVLILGTVCFAAGSAGYLRVPSVVVAFVAGVILANLSGDYIGRVREMLERMERPVYLLTLVVVGALWQFHDWRAWLLMPIFAGMRLAGKALAARLASARGDLLTLEERRAMALSPIGALAIAIVISARLLYPDASISLLVSAVVGGSVLTELVVQFSGRVAAGRETRPEQASPGGAGS